MGYFLNLKRCDVITTRYIRADGHDGERDYDIQHINVYKKDFVSITDLNDRREHIYYEDIIKINGLGVIVYEHGKISRYTSGELYGGDSKYFSHLEYETNPYNPQNNKDMARIKLNHGDKISTNTFTLYDVKRVIDFHKYSVEIEDLDDGTYMIEYDEIREINDIDLYRQINDYGEISEHLYREIYGSKVSDVNSDWGNAKSIAACDSDGIGAINDYVKESYDNKKSTNDKNTEIMTNSMNITNIFPKVELGLVESDMFKLGLDGVAVKNNEGEYVSYDKNSGEITDMAGMVFDGGQFFTIPTMTVKEGELVKKGNIIGYVEKVNPKSIEITDVLTGEIKQIRPKKNVFGFGFYTKVISLFDMALGDEEEEGIDPMMMMFLMNGKKENNQMFETVMLMNMMGAKSEMSELLPLLLMNGENSQNMLPLMMMMDSGEGEKSSKLEKMLPLMMMMGGQGGQNQMNQMLPLMMMSKGKSDSKFGKMLPMMMLMGNQSGDNNMMAQMIMMNFLSDMNKKKVSTEEVGEGKVILTQEEFDQLKEKANVKDEE